MDPLTTGVITKSPVLVKVVGEYIALTVSSILGNENSCRPEPEDDNFT